MFRTSRDTSEWLQIDNKGSIKDKKYNVARAPGIYDPTSKSLGDKQKIISHNYGTVPFGTQFDRFNNDYKQPLPGPGSYEREVQRLTKPIPTKY